MKYSEFLKWEPRSPGNAFIFICPDDLLLDESRNVWGRIFGGDWVFERLGVREFEGMEGSELLEAALGPPLFGPARALLVSGAGKVTKKKMALVEEVGALPESSLKIILVASSRRELPKSKGRLPTVEVDAIRAPDAVRWLRDRFGIGPDVATYLVETLGPELGPLAAEMEKLQAYVRESRPIELSDVDLLTIRAEQFSPFDLDDALIAGDRTKAVRVATAMIEEGVEPLIVLSRFARVWRQLFIGKMLGQTPSAGDVAARVSVPHWKAGAFRAACLRFDWDTLAGGFRELVVADRRFKTGSSEPALVLDLLCWNLLKSETR